LAGFTFAFGRSQSPFLLFGFQTGPSCVVGDRPERAFALLTGEILFFLFRFVIVMCPGLGTRITGWSGRYIPPVETLFFVRFLAVADFLAGFFSPRGSPSTRPSPRFLVKALPGKS